jgi:hypothetical protein
MQAFILLIPSKKSFRWEKFAGKVPAMVATVQRAHFEKIQ